MSKKKDLNHHDQLPKHGDRDEVFLSEYVLAVREEIPEEDSWRLARSKLEQRLKLTPSRRTLMLHVFDYTTRHRWLAASALAALFLSIFIGLNPWSHSLAFATVIQKIRDIPAYITKTTYSVNGGQVFTIETQYLAPGKWRIQNIGDNVHIIDLEQGLMLNLFPASKNAIVLPIGKQEVTEEYEHMWLEELGSYEGQADEVLPEKIVNGQYCKGFILSRVEHELTIWADSETGLPIRLEISFHGPMTPSMEIDVTYPENLDPDLFSLEIPDDYQISEQPDGDDPQ